MINDDNLWETQKSIAYLIDGVAKREWVNTDIDVDYFARLREDSHIRNAQVAQLYEEYFFPERHEHEWQILTEIIGLIVTAPATEALVMAVSTGVVGNAAYELLRNLCVYVAEQYKTRLHEKARSRGDSFQQIADDIGKIQTFFREKPRARIAEIESATDVPREKIYPIMKIAGLNHCRRGDNTCYWELP